MPTRAVRVSVAASATLALSLAFTPKAWAQG